MIARWAIAALSCLLASPAGAYTSPFGPSAPWNQPVAGQAVDPDSDSLVQRLWDGKGAGTRTGADNLNLTTHDYSFPIYDIAGASGSCLVKSRTGRASNIIGRYIPCNPAWQPSHGVSWPAGSSYDSQMIVLDPATGREWDIWRYAYASGVVTVSNGNLVTNADGSPADYRVKVDGYPPSRGAGIPYLAMLPRPQEVAQGIVPHALPLLVPVTSSTTYRYPATKLEGGSWATATGLPEGTRYALRVSDADVTAWLGGLPSSCLSATGKASLRVLAVAMRDFGWFVTDHAGSTHTQLEDVAEPAAKTGWAGLGMATAACAANGKVYPQDAVDGLVTRARLVALVPPAVAAALRRGHRLP